MLQINSTIKIPWHGVQTFWKIVGPIGSTLCRGQNFIGSGISVVLTVRIMFHNVSVSCKMNVYIPTRNMIAKVNSGTAAVLLMLIWIYEAPFHICSIYLKTCLIFNNKKKLHLTIVKHEFKMIQFENDELTCCIDPDFLNLPDYVP